MRGWISGTILALALAGAAGPAIAASPTPEQLAAMTGLKLRDTVNHLLDVKERSVDQDCDLATYYGELARRSAQARMDGVAAMLRGVCLYRRDDNAGAIERFEAAEPALARLSDLGPLMDT